MHGSFKDLQFSNTACHELRIDPNETNTVRQVNGYHYSLTPTTPLRDPILVGLSKDACKLIDLEPSEVKKELDYLIGSKVPASSKVGIPDFSRSLIAMLAISLATWPVSLEMEELYLWETSKTRRESFGTYSIKAQAGLLTRELLMEEPYCDHLSENFCAVSTCTFWGYPQLEL